MCFESSILGYEQRAREKSLIYDLDPRRVKMSPDVGLQKSVFSKHYMNSESVMNA